MGTFAVGTTPETAEANEEEEEEWEDVEEDEEDEDEEGAPACLLQAVFEERCRRWRSACARRLRDIYAEQDVLLSRHDTLVTDCTDFQDEFQQLMSRHEKLDDLTIRKAKDMHEQLQERLQILTEHKEWLYAEETTLVHAMSPSGILGLYQEHFAAYLSPRADPAAFVDLLRERLDCFTDDDPPRWVRPSYQHLVRDVSRL